MSLPHLPYLKTSKRNNIKEEDNKLRFETNEGKNKFVECLLQFITSWFIRPLALALVYINFQHKFQLYSNTALR